MSEGTRQPDPRDAPRRLPITNYLGLVLLAAALVASLVRVYSAQREEYDPNKTILRIAHWQLEMGYREALNEVIREYEKLHPDVKVVQLAVSERVFTQWLNTALLSGEGPDLVEMGAKSKLTHEPGYVGRFFLPLTEHVNQKNPYNDGTSLEGVPWRDTFVDGMQGGYQYELQDYFSAPTAVFPIRLFYNKNAVQAATGQPELPAGFSFGQLLELSGQLRALARRDPRYRNLQPIAGSEYVTSMMLGKYQVPFTAPLEPLLDVDLNGDIDHWETYLGYRAGKVGFQSRAIKGFYECARALSSQFTPGFMANKRDESVFDFVLERAAMIASGAWDAESLFQQARFPIGVVDIPLPRPGERWGDQVAGRANEAAATAGAGYGVSKTSRHMDQAVDFLKFLTSMKANQRYAEKAGWVPATLGAAVVERMKPFVPDPTGYHAGAKAYLGWDGNLEGDFKGFQASFLQGDYRHPPGDAGFDTDPDGYLVFAGKVDQLLTSPKSGGDGHFARFYDSRKTWVRNLERNLAVHYTRALMDPQAGDAQEKLRRGLLQQVRENGGHWVKQRFEEARGIPIEVK